MDCPMKCVEKPMEGPGNEQCDAFRAGQAECLWNQFPDDHVESAQESECRSQCHGMGHERSAPPETGGPNRLKYFRERRFAKRADGEAGEGDAKLYAGDDAMQITEEHLNNTGARD